MVGDDNEAGHGTPEHAGTVAEPKALDPTPPRTSGASEWTASDARGPLNAVGSAASAAESHAAPAYETTSASPPNETTTAAAVVPPRRASLVPVAVGIVVGALIGAGSAYYIYGMGAADTSALDQKIAALSGRVDELAKRPDAGQAIAPLKASLGDLAGRVTAAEAAAKAATAKAEAVTSQPQAAAAGPDVAALRQKLATLDSSVSSLKQDAASTRDLKASETKIAAVATSVADIQKQAISAQSDVQSLRAGQKALEGKITSAPALAVVADSLVQQIHRGLPFAAQVEALATLGVDPAKIAVLRQSADQGVPSASVLADKFEPLTDGLLSATHKVPATAGFWDRMKDGVGGLVSVHRVDDVGGDDPASRVARIRADLVHDDVIDAVATWNKLPAEAKTKPEAQAWGALAKTHADAMAAASAIESDAITALGAKKS